MMTDGRQPTTDSAPALRALLAEIVDYAGLFPPARLAMEPAVACYAEALVSPAAWMLGRFVVPLARLDEFEAAVASYAESMERSPWRLSALGAGESETELAALEAFNHRWAARAQMDAFETRVSDAAEIERVRRALPVGVAAYLELPVEADPAPLVAAVGAAGLRAKIRTGGIKPEAFPSPAEVLRFLAACARLDVPFKATAGLHHPLRAEYALTYEPDAPRGLMFGYLNVFLAAALLRAGEVEAVAAEMLVESNPAALRLEVNGLRWRNHLLDAEMLRQARRSFAVSFGSCSFDELVEGMVGIRGQSSGGA